PTPTRRRPDANAARVASSRASTTGFRKATSRTQKPTVMRSVDAMIVLTVTTDSSSGRGCTRWSPTYRPSNPASSAHRAVSTTRPAAARASVPVTVGSMSETTGRTGSLNRPATSGLLASRDDAADLEVDDRVPVELGELGEDLFAVLVELGRAPRRVGFVVEL